MPTVAMRAARRRSIEANLFPYSHPAVEPWDKFRWHSAVGEHCDTWKQHSSQALAIDVFGTLKMHPGRDAALNAIAASLSLPVGGPWTVALEWRDPNNRLREKTRTSVDAMARSPNALILFECKFSEHDGGTCSQTHPLPTGRRKGLRQCNGYYAPQVNPANQLEARCALSAKGIGYWEAIPAVFGFPAESSIAPCPFAGGWFQWMRNLTTCYAVARHDQLRAAFVVAYADGPGLPMAQRVKQADWQWLNNRVDPAAVLLRAVSIQTMLSTVRDAAPGDAVWPELLAWVTSKVNSVCGV